MGSEPFTNQPMNQFDTSFFSTVGGLNSEHSISGAGLVCFLLFVAAIYLPRIVKGHCKTRRFSIHGPTVWY